MKRDLAEAADHKLKKRRLMEQLQEECTEEEIEELLKELRKKERKKGGASRRKGGSE